MSRIVKCDRCGRDITNRDKAFFAFHRKNEETGKPEGKNPYEDWDFCEQCVNEIRQVIERNKRD